MVALSCNTADKNVAEDVHLYVTYSMCTVQYLCDITFSDQMFNHN